ncbi:MAG: hypothetical protein CVV21_11675 [Candidatus Goldiibacteriota bacterium HGW-Goldbacteria-1]|jgi:rhodanese-related sulfurtransferase|nr:MAG: hypothetical protein CVV21_11675 [Candidatus Goldiibacteriota bacterium HGW-Goldbacteria-1]
MLDLKIYEVNVMAKARPAKKVIKKTISEPEIKNKPGINKSLITAAVIIAVAVAAGVIATLTRSKNLSSQPAVSSTTEGSITINDPATNQSFQLNIDPASASSQPAGVQNTMPSAKADFSYLLKNAASKTEILKIGLDEAKYLYDNGKAVFIDSRSYGEYEQAHIKGALSIPVGTAVQDIEKNKAVLSQKGKVLITYCHGVGCHLSDKTAYSLYDAGYKNVVIFFGGWNSWSEANYPEYKKAQ